MKTSLTEYLTGLTDLRHYIDGLEIEAKVLSSTISCKKASDCRRNLLDFQDHWSRSLIRKRQFNYNSIIVSLYGYLEQFIESLVSGVAKTINNIVPSYTDLPHQVQGHHLRLSLNLINNVRFKDRFTTQKVIENLNYCVSGTPPYFLNSLAFAQHSANFKMEVINENFKYIGVESVCEKSLLQQGFEEYLALKYTERTKPVKPEEVFFILQDLAERRNQVAHGVLPDELLSNEFLRSYIVFFEAFGKALFQVCQSEVLPYKVQHQSIPLGEPTDVFKSGSVICIDISHFHIKIGDEIFAQSGDGKTFYSGMIQEIKIDDEKFTEYLVTTKIEVGLRLSFKAKKNYKFFLPNIGP